MNDATITVEAWAAITIKEWIAKARTLDVPDGQLLSSFQSHVVTNADGDPIKVEFLFNWYGRMVDMGVGSGVPLDVRDAMISGGMTKRRPKPFLYVTFYKQLAVLRHLLAEKNALKIERFIIQQIEAK